MSNNLRTRNGLPFSFPDGIKVRGVDIEDYFNSLDPGTAVGPLAPLQSPNFTGTPTAPTPVAGTNTTQLATTEFVTAALTNAEINGIATDIGITANSSTITLTSSTGNGTTIPAATTTSAGAMSSADKVALTGKQDTLVSGTNIKTINGQNILGTGDIAIATPSIPTIQRGIGVADGDAFASVVFNNPFSAPPTVVCSPTLGGTNRVYSCEVIESSITNDGFRVAFTYIDMTDHTQKVATLGDRFLWIAVGA